MKSISIRELHEKTGEWVRRSEKLGAITVTDRGKAVARIDRLRQTQQSIPLRRVSCVEVTHACSARSRGAQTARKRFLKTGTGSELLRLRLHCKVLRRRTGK